MRVRERCLALPKKVHIRKVNTKELSGNSREFDMLLNNSSEGGYLCSHVLGFLFFAESFHSSAIP